MEHFTNGVTAAIGAALLFFMTFTSCVKTSTQPSDFHAVRKTPFVDPEVAYTEHPLRKNIHSVLPSRPEKKTWPGHRSKSYAILQDSSIKTNYSLMKRNKDTITVNQHEAYESYTSSSAKGISVAAMERVLEWLRLLPFIPLAIGVGLMRRKMKAMQQEKADTIIFLGGLISLLIVILLIVLIINLI